MTTVMKKLKRLQERHAIWIIGIFVAYLLVLNIHTVMYIRNVFIQYTLDSVENELKMIRMVTDERKKEEAIMLAQKAYPGITYEITDHYKVIRTGLSDEVSNKGYAVKFEKQGRKSQIVFVYRMETKDELYVVGVLPFISVIDNKAGRIQLILCAQSICMFVAVFIIGLSLITSKKRRDKKC